MFEHSSTKSTFQLLTLMYKKGGVQAFYSGLLPSLVKSGVSTSIYFGLYDYISRLIIDNNLFKWFCMFSVLFVFYVWSLCILIHSTLPFCFEISMIMYEWSLIVYKLFRRLNKPEYRSKSIFLIVWFLWLQLKFYIFLFHDGYLTLIYSDSL